MTHRAPAAFLRAPAVFLTVDSATVSGVALCTAELDGRGRVAGYDVVEMGEVKTQGARYGWALEAVGEAKGAGLPLVVIGEEWTPHGISTATLASLCESWGKWLAAFEQAGIPESHIVRANPNTWRAAVFGKGRPKTTAGLKVYAQKYVEQALDMPKLSDNLAEALCLRVWAERAAEVHALLAPKKSKRKKAA